MKIIMTGGREASVEIEFVDSNYHAKNPGEKLVKIEGAVSAETLNDIILLLNLENDNV